MKKRIKCFTCLEALISDNILSQNTLVEHKNKGGLIMPSFSVVSICMDTETFLQREIKISKDGLLTSKDVSSIAYSSLLHSDCKSIFSSLDNHLFDSGPTSNHAVLLIKCCIDCYLKIRMHYLGKSFSEKILGPKVRKTFSKYILFKHQ